MKRFNIIVALDAKFGIGRCGVLPWKLKNELKWFNMITTRTQWIHQQNAVIMGKNTWFSIPEAMRPLKNRFNIVVSKTVKESGDMRVVGSLDGALKCASENDAVDNIFVIGGRGLYEEALRHEKLNELYMTKIDGDFKCDTFFPRVGRELTKICTSPIYNEKDGGETCTYTIEHYKCVESGERQYLNLMKNVLLWGNMRDARNGMTIALFGAHMEFDMSDGSLPVITTKKIFIRGVFEELMFFLSGKTDTNLLRERGVNIWNANTSRQFLDSVGLNSYEEGDIGTAYSFQFRHYGATYVGMKGDYTGQGVDQFDNLISDIVKNRYSRRLIMTTYNPCQINQGPLPPCHGIVIQFGIEGHNRLSCHMYQRSADLFLGVPWNITSYALLMRIVVEIVNGKVSEPLVPGTLYMSFGDYHLYEGHKTAAEKQIERVPFKFPKMRFNKKVNGLGDLTWKDITIDNYKYHPNDFNVEMVA